MGCSRPNGIVPRAGGSKFIGAVSREYSALEYKLYSQLGLQLVPCGHCELCLVTRRYERALRIMLEVESFQDSSYFLTLTYSDEHLGSRDLVHSDWSQFMKDFRRSFCEAKYCDVGVPRHWKRFGAVRSETFKSVKQVMCGEYGDYFGRKHFHGIIFGHEFRDMVATGTFSSRGQEIFTSPSLRDVWKKGFVQIAPVTMDLALYVSSYITDQSLDVRPDLGFSKPQYGRFGRGIGRSWLDKYWRDVLNAGSLELSNGSFPIPRTFLRWYADHPDFLEWKARKALTVSEKNLDLILKEDGPIRRAFAKGRIFSSIHKKKELDNGFKSQVT